MTDYSAKWRGFKRVRAAYWLVSFVGLVVLAGLMTINPKMIYASDNFTSLGIILVLTWIVAQAITGYQVYWFRCPRCHKFFSKISFNEGLIAPNCAHCGLPRYADSDNAVHA